MTEERLSDEQWLALQFDALTDAITVALPSTWAEEHRYLPPSTTALPGPFRFSVAPYCKEILDCLSVDSPIREVAWMKGVQICATTAVLENALGYCIEHVKTAPVMLLTADAELAKIRLEAYIIPMLQASGMEHLIASSDEGNARKTGKTDKKLEWFGGGFLIPFGAKNANKLRSIPIRFLLRDEIDAYPALVGKDGDPMKLSFDRTAAFEGSRKILDISTPLIRGQSNIERRFKRGDQRRYFVRCLKCNFSQELRFQRTDSSSGELTGITWETENDQLVHDSVRYLCKECGHPHTNDDKTRLLDPDHGAEWKPTAPGEPFVRSYHLSALYSPVGMQTWAACVLKYLDGWDVSRNRVKDLGSFQVFYNNVLGEPFELRGEKVRFEAVSGHRRHDYHFGQIPNSFAVRHCGGPVLLLTCTVDVHKDNLAVAVFGWCRDRRAILVDYWRFEGETDRLDEAATWGRLRTLIQTPDLYAADDGKKYAIALTLIDSGYRTDDVYRFADEHDGGVFPVKGRDAPSKSATLREFSDFTTPMGTRAYAITVDFYKDRWSAALRRSWDGLSLQPQGHFNAPLDATDAQLKELTVEQKKEQLEPGTQNRIGSKWVRPSGAANELWDLLVYANAALDLIAWDVCKNELELESVNWVAFYDLLAERKPYFTE